MISSNTIDVVDILAFLLFRVIQICYNACMKTKSQCSECLTKKGEYHVCGCLQEQCPTCKGIRATCDCITSYEPDPFGYLSRIKFGSELDFRKDGQQEE